MCRLKLYAHIFYICLAAISLVNHCSGSINFPSQFALSCNLRTIIQGSQTQTSIKIAIRQLMFRRARRGIFFIIFYILEAEANWNLHLKRNKTESFKIGGLNTKHLTDAVVIQNLVPEPLLPLFKFISKVCRYIGNRFRRYELFLKSFTSYPIFTSVVTYLLRKSDFKS